MSYGHPLTPAVTPELLQMLGSIARPISPEALAETLDGAAETICVATRADDCEIYLCEPEGGDLVLAASRGRDRDSLLKRTRFGLGVGFPGIAAATGRSIISSSLRRDRRFLRRSAVRAGVQAFVAAPLQCEHGVVGCVCLGWRSCSAPVKRGAAVLATVLDVLTTVIRSALLAARERVEDAATAAGPEREACARACLQAMIATARARGGTMTLFHAEGQESNVYSAAMPIEICRNALDGRMPCGTVAAGHGVALPCARSRWPSHCRGMPAGTLAPVCLPLRAHGRLHGMVVLDRGSAVPSPQSSDLVPLLAMAREAAVRLVGPAQRDPTSDAAPDAVLEIRGLGGFEVRLHGELLLPERFVRRKALTLLKLLILHEGHPVSRYALAEHLWPGVDERTSANRLHGVLHTLRSAIEPSRAQRQWLYVCNVGELYYFNMESPHWIDISAFRRHAMLGSEASRHGRIQQAIRHFEAAVGLYRGDLFADEPYAAWCEPDRSRLRQQSVDLASALAELWARVGEPDRSIAWLRCALQGDHLREDLHRALIQRLFECGRVREALIQYDTCVRQIREELGAEVQPETHRLRALIASGEADSSKRAH